MRNRIYAAAIATVGGALALVGHGTAVDPPKPVGKKPPTVMQRKLAHGQKVLEGLAMSDFAKIGAEADELLGCARDASWRALKTPKYELYSNDFVRHLEEMKTAAANKNLDAATVAYIETTLTCVKCHQHVRSEGVGLLPPVLPQEGLAKRAQ